MPKEIEQQSPFELVDDEDQKVDTDVSVEETQHNVSQKIIDHRKAQREFKEQEEAWEQKRKMQEDEALAIEELQKALEEDPLAGVTVHQLDREESLDRKFTRQLTPFEKKLPTPPPTLWQRIKKLFSR